MKKNGIDAVSAAVLCIMLIAGGALLPAGTAWGAPGPTQPPALFNTPLNQIPVPEPPNLFEFVRSKAAAIKLGKALFWDMQAGSDNIQACGSCHFHAGADNRVKNTVNPGTRGNDNTFQVRGPNDIIQPTDFPFHLRVTPDVQNPPLLARPDVNDIVGSQGVKLTNFVAINATTGEETGTAVADQLFHTGNKANQANVANANPANNTRRVTARNTPTNINAIFNFHNFWDGRAHFIFNGVNPFGPLDTAARVWVNIAIPPASPLLQQQKIEIENASLASQATGPPLDDTEMSATGRTFPELGRKLLKLRPLGKQFVHPNDSVLGQFSRAVLLSDGKLGGSQGLNDTTTYEQMIKDAFQRNLWDSAPQTVNMPTRAVPAGEAFNQMEANFSLFWGLAIQLYEATLVSDQTPFDRFLGGNQTALDAIPGAADGMNVFFGGGKCDVCHFGTELTSATVRNARFITNNDNAIVDQMPVAAGQQTIYDNGFNNTAVRKITDDIGRGGDSPFMLVGGVTPTPLSYCAQAQIQLVGNLPFLSVVLPNPQQQATMQVSNNGAFKVPGLRNVELTAPYFHDGGTMTLEDVVDFYTRGGNFPVDNINHLDFNMVQNNALANPATMAQLVAFMKSLTDPRVKDQSAPFDHPELFIPNGDPNITDPDLLTRIPAKGADGTAALPSGFRIDPVATPTNKPSQLISGAKDFGATVQVIANGVPMTVTGAAADSTWSTTVGNLLEGINAISVTSIDASGSITLNANITLDTAAPALDLNNVTTPIRNRAQIISGTVEANITPVVKTDTAATVGPVSVSGSNWSAQLTLLRSGPNAVTVTATDPAGNVATKTTSIVVFGDGIFNGTQIPDISDALKALRMAVGLIAPTPDDMNHGDVAPLGAPDGKIDIADALLIMRNVVGTVSLIN